MSRSAGDINAKIAYLTNKKTGPLLKAKRPFVLKYFPKKLEIKGRCPLFDFVKFITTTKLLKLKHTEASKH